MFQSVTTAEEVQRVIAYWASEGATWVKFMGGITRDMLRAGVEAAHARRMRVTGHLCSVTFTEAAALGVDLLQHGFITNSEYVPGKQPDVCPAGNQRVQADVDVSSAGVQESIRAIVAAGTAVASTLSPYETFMPDRGALDTRTLETLAPDTRKEMHSAPSVHPCELPQLRGASKRDKDLWRPAQKLQHFACGRRLLDQLGDSVFGEFIV